MLQYEPYGIQPQHKVLTCEETCSYQFYPNTLYFITREKLKLPVEAVKTVFFFDIY